MWLKVQHLFYGIIISFNTENNTIRFKKDYDHEIITVYIPNKNIIKIMPYVNNGKTLGININVEQNLVDFSFNFLNSELIDTYRYSTNISKKDLENLLNKESGWSDIDDPEKYIRWLRGN